MPSIEIKLFATLAAYTPADAQDYSIKSGTTIAQLIQRLGLPEDQAKLIFINGVRSETNTQLRGGERVGIFPPVGGG